MTQTAESLGLTFKYLQIDDPTRQSRINLTIPSIMVDCRRDPEAEAVWSATLAVYAKREKRPNPDYVRSIVKANKDISSSSKVFVGYKS